MITISMLPLLCCPRCGTGELTLEGGEPQAGVLLSGTLGCASCGARYPIEEGVADLVPEGVLDSSDWALWREHLDGFNERRNQRAREPDRLVNRVGKPQVLHEAFAEFIGIHEGTVLDVGCGPGKFRHLLDEARVSYFGIDPLVLPDTQHCQYLRALGEYIPFKPAVFTDVLALSSLDHVKDRGRFFAEIHRVLKPGGRFHLLQSTHEVRGIGSAAKMVAHWVKDTIEDRLYKSDAPHHMAEFTRTSLFATLSEHFEVVSSRPYSEAWYSPNNLFVTMRPKA